MSLTTEQERAVTSPVSATVIASAGTGKTTVLTERFAHILREGLPAFRILAFTFTEKATREMKERILKKSQIGLESVPLLNISTIHSFCSSILRRHGELVGLKNDFEILQDHAYKVWLKARIRKHIQALLLEKDETFLFFYHRYGLKNLQLTMEALSEKNLILLPRENLNCLNHFEESECQLYDLFLKRNANFQKALLKERIQNATLSYDDLETLTLQIFDKHPEVLSSLQNLFAHILVDEFQDVSPQQFEIIKRLFYPNKNTLFIVGDPKQSIYGFRQADTRLFFEMQSLILKSGGQSITLSQTFRTPKTLQSYFNQVFPAVLNQNGQALFEPAHTEREEVQARVYATQLPSTELSAADFASELFPSVVDLIHKLVQAGVKPKDIAVLSSSRKNFTELKKRLNVLNIPTISETKGALFDEDLILFFYHVLLYLSGVREKIVLVGILRSPLLNFSEDFIRHWIKQESVDFTQEPTTEITNVSDREKYQILLKNLKLWQTQSQSLFVRELVYSLFTMIVQTPTARDWLLVGNFVQILSSWQKQGFTTLAEILPLLRDLESSAIEFNPPSAQEDGVALLTIHGSKGLEFNHVILIPGSENSSESKTFLYQTGKGFIFKSSDWGQEKGLKYELTEPDEYVNLKQELKIQDQSETTRLVYVALTRAMKNLFLFPAPPSSKKIAESLSKNPTQTQGLNDYNNWLAWLSIQEQVSPLKDFRSLNLVVDDDNKDKTKLITALSLNPSLASSSKPILTVTELEVFDNCQKKFELVYLNGLQAIQRQNFLNKSELDAYDPKLIFESSQISSLQRGNLYHEILQFYDPMRDNLQKVIDQALFNQHLTDPEDAIRKQGENLVANLENSEFLNQVLFQNLKAHSELEFTLDLDSFLISGQMDKLVQIAGNNGPEWMVVDYKTHRLHHDFEQDQLTERFRFQMLCYALAVKKNYGQDEVQTLIVFTSTGAHSVLKFNKAQLEKFEEELKELYAGISRSISKKNFATTQHKRLCQKCSFYKDNYCGVGSLLTNES